MYVWLVIDDDEGGISGVYTTREVANQAADIAGFDPVYSIQQWEVSETVGV